ncbi:hypothetical protein LBMAG49_22850 [Planctomycetota bacterium]|nr:hypothetical protein LBMAG49_22850 [Planctomycetota bacterium]
MNQPQEVSGQVPDGADERMAQMLSSTLSSADLRQQLKHETSADAEDLLSRIQALDFLNSVVGESCLLPERLGDYQIRGVLGRGGMGIVYLAYQAELEREVALKVLSQVYSTDSTMRQRFRAEARATAALHHRHIVPIYGYGEAQGQLYFAMERVDGMSLDKHIAAARRMGKPPMAPLDAARSFAGVADALGLAHRRRLLHRDVKPGNILVGGDGTLALTDFGLAKALDQASASLTKNSGGFLGTLHYSSPEQAIGRELTPASDLYSLGVTLFEAVTGELPLVGKTTEAVLQSLLHGMPRRLRDLLARPPRDLEAVLDKLLSREPQDRYQDGEVLAKDLVRVADGDPVNIRRPPLVLRIYRRARKNPVLSGTLVAATLLLLSTFFLLNVVRKEQGVNLQARQLNSLNEAARAIAGEAGYVWGQSPLLACLSGATVKEQATGQALLTGWIERAKLELANDARWMAMSSAYQQDPLPAASDFLRAGRGYEALQLLREAIAQSVSTGGDLEVKLRLYRLYLASAVANLTASVGRLSDARTDLARASFLRPGALFPQALDVVLQIADADDVPLVLAVIERDHLSAAKEHRAVVGRLLVAIAGIENSQFANLMSLPLAFADRRAVLALGRRWADEVEVDQKDSKVQSLSQALAAKSQSLVLPGAEPGHLHTAAMALTAEIRRSVHPQSLLQSFQGLVQLLEQGRTTGPLLDPDGRPLSPQQQLSSWSALIHLRSTPQLLLDRIERFDVLQTRYPALPGMTQIAAQLHSAAGSERASLLARNWVQDQPEDPEALYCRMRTWLRAAVARPELGAELDRALDDATACIQRAIDRDEMLDRIIKAWKVASFETVSDPRRAAIFSTVAALRESQ